MIQVWVDQKRKILSDSRTYLNASKNISMYLSFQTTSKYAVDEPCLLCFCWINKSVLPIFQIKLPSLLFKLISCLCVTLILRDNLYDVLLITWPAKLRLVSATTYFQRGLPECMFVCLNWIEFSVCAMFQQSKSDLHISATKIWKKRNRDVTLTSTSLTGSWFVQININDYVWTLNSQFIEEKEEKYKE